MSERTALVDGYYFTGPYPLNGGFNAVAGIYIITTPEGTIIDVGETGNLDDRISSHERKPCWMRNNGSSLWFHGETNMPARLIKEKFLRGNRVLACGVF